MRENPRFGYFLDIAQYKYLLIKYLSWPLQNLSKRFGTLRVHIKYTQGNSLTKGNNNLTRKHL